MTSPSDFDAFALIDSAVAAGGLAIGESGALVVPDQEATAQRLDAVRDERKLAEPVASDDSSDQEVIILGWALQGEQDNALRWARFRSALGLAPQQELPAHMWTDDSRLLVAREIDRSFRGQTDVRQINGRALIEGYRLRAERDQVTGSLQRFAQLTQELTAAADSYCDNDAHMAIEILQSKRARSRMAALVRDIERGLRADRPAEQVVAAAAEGVEQARALVAGRLGTDHTFDDHTSIAGRLQEAMVADRGEVIPTGIYGLDIDLIGGHNPMNTGKLWILGARTGVGKTTVAIGASMALARGGADVLFLSCELDGLEIGARAFANQARANGFNTCQDWILEGRGRDRVVPEQFHEARDTWAQQIERGECGQYQTKALFMASAEQFVEFMYAAKARNPRLSVVVMDHFHAMAPSKGYGSRSQEMEARALLLHQAAKQCGVNLLLLTQLNREACLAKKPELEHINGTDALGQLASVVWLLEFPKRAEHEPFNPSFLALHHAKFRNGQRYQGQRVNEDVSGLMIAREYCEVRDCALP